jgi:hypoxanthine phosphoribosyltransferase
MAIWARNEADFERIMISEQEINVKVKELGKIISEDYKDKNLMLLSVLKGSIVFMSQLMLAITIPAQIDFMAVSSYGKDTKSSGVVKIVKDIDINLEKLDVLLVEDILDSGMTLSYLKELLLSRNPSSIKIVTLLDKPTRRVADIKADYFGFEIEDEFVVGYGLDYSEYYRNMPNIGVLKKEVYTEINDF